MDSMGDLAKQMRQIGTAIANTRKVAKTALASAKDSPSYDVRRVQRLESTVADLSTLLGHHEAMMSRYKAAQG